MGRRDNSGSRGTGRREATMLTYKANAVRQFMKRLQEISEAWETKEDGQPDLWYRGLQKSSWLLVPKVAGVTSQYVAKSAHHVGNRREHKVRLRETASLHEVSLKPPLEKGQGVDIAGGYRHDTPKVAAT